MPSGGSSPLEGDAWEYFCNVYYVAKKNGLEYEFLQWFLGGLVNEKLSIENAATAAAVEWDF